MILLPLPVAIASGVEAPPEAIATVERARARGKDIVFVPARLLHQRVGAAAQ